MSDPAPRTSLSHFQGCLLGGAGGDALGAAVEFDSLASIRAKFGPNGIRNPARCYGRVGAITDDTQMTLFTAEGLLRAHHRLVERGIASIEQVVWFAYLRWLRTQGCPTPAGLDYDPCHAAGWLFGIRELHTRRAPGNTCLSALSSGRMGTPREPINGSKGCGGVMRVAPAGLVGNEPFALGQKLAAITHGHPTGHVAAGCFAHILSNLTKGAALRDAVDGAIAVTSRAAGCAETVEVLKRAVSLSERSSGTPEDVQSLGGGWVAEEALAIAVYCALRANDFADGVRLAVNHSGDSDSTGSMTGNILGLLYGQESIPRGWLEVLELREVIEELANDLWWHFAAVPPAPCSSGDGEACGQWDRYPGA